MAKTSGVNLMELMVVIAIIAILASVAYPNYIRIKKESRRADAQSAVVATQAIVERYLAENDKANIDSSDMALAQFTNYNPGSSTPVLSNAGYYIITIVPDSSSYTVNAIALANGTTSACSSVPSAEESYDQCADTTCWIISNSDTQKQSTNNLGVVADETTTTCW